MSAGSREKKKGGGKDTTQEEESDDDVVEKIPVDIKTNIVVKYQFDTKSHCAFDNMADTINRFQDHDEANWYFIIVTPRYTSLIRDLYIDKHSYTHARNDFFLARQILRQFFKYNTTFEE